jgi:oligosaccharide repeat unit polymerase
VTGYIIAIPCFAFLLSYWNYLKFRRLLNPITIILLWWSFWLFVSNWSLAGLNIPSGRTQTMVLIMLFAVFLGSKLAKTEQPEDVRLLELNQNVYRNWQFLSRLNLLVAPIVLFYFIRALHILPSADPVKYRTAVFGVGEKPSILFGQGYMQILYKIIVSPFIFFSMILGILFFLKYRNKRLLLIPLFLIALDAVMTLGRFNFYYVLVFFWLSYLFLRQRFNAAHEEEGSHSYLSKRKGKSGLFILLVIMASMLIVLSVVRGERKENVFSTVRMFAINYHTVGFVLFDTELSAPSSRLNTRVSYGRSTFGGLDTLLSLILRRFDSRIVPMAGENGQYMHAERVIGLDKNNQPIKGNAFYTILYSLYLDGRYFFVILMPFLFGYFVAAHYLRWIKNGSFINLAFLIILMYLALFSLFQSPVEGLKFWIGLLLVVLLRMISFPAPGEDKETFPEHPA